MAGSMSKVTSDRIAAIKANFEHGEVITEANLADLIDAIAEAAQEHEHTTSGGPGSGTGDAGPVLKWSTFLDPGEAARANSSPAELVETGTPFTSWYELRYDQNAIEYASWLRAIPAWYAGGSLKATVFWKAQATSGAVRWALNRSDRAPGEAWGDIPTEEQATTTPAQGTSEYLNSTVFTWETTPDPGDVIIIDLARQAWHDEDTMTGDAKVLGVLIEET